MKVFNLYFKVLRKYIGQIFMYVGIFAGVLVGVIIPQNVNNDENSFVKSKNDFAVFDYDNSELSTALTDYLSEKHDLKVIKDDSGETIQDELYAMEVHNVIRFEEGFEEAYINGDESLYPEVYAIPNTIVEVLFEQDVNGFLSIVKTYINAGFDMDEAITKTLEASDKQVEVDMIEESETSQPGALHYFFKYLSWVFIASSVSAITTVLISLNKKNVRERIECSPYKFIRMNGEILLGVVVTGFAVCMLFVIIASSLFAEEMFSLSGLLYVLNAFCIMSVALAITFLISKLTANLQVISLLSNVIGLGMAFLCGVFVPMEFLSGTVIKIAHFLPAYWNVKAIEIIDSFSSGDLQTLLSYMGIQILFAVAICCVALVVAGRKRQTA